MLGTETTDELLLASVATEPDAFAVFYRRHEDRILRYFLRRGATAELAADLTAEVFAAALVGADGFDSQAPPVAWLYGIARNTLAASRSALERAAVEARVLNERDYRDIAAELCCSEAVVRQRVSRGLARLRRQLERRRTT